MGKKIISIVNSSYVYGTNVTCNKNLESGVTIRIWAL